MYSIDYIYCALHRCRVLSSSPSPHCQVACVLVALQFALPPRRTIDSFYVVRAFDSAVVGGVFLSKRASDDIAYATSRRAIPSQSKAVRITALHARAPRATGGGETAYLLRAQEHSRFAVQSI
jgi:hypothetical protein